MQTHRTSALGRAAPGSAGWAVIAVAGLVLLVLGLAQKFYLGAVADDFERDRTGNTLILIGAPRSR
jgi:hypothetical protein